MANGQITVIHPTAGRRVVNLPDDPNRQTIGDVLNFLGGEFARAQQVFKNTDAGVQPAGMRDRCYAGDCISIVIPTKAGL